MKTLQQIADLTGAELRGNPQLAIHGVETLAGSRPGCLTFVSESAHLADLGGCPASAVIVPASLNDEAIMVDGKGVLVCEDALAAFRLVAREFHAPPRPRQAGISPRAFVSPTARIDPTARICPGAFIDDNVTIGPGCTVYPGVCILAGCSLGRDVTLFPNAVLYENTVVADRCVIHSGAVLGAWGFGYESGPEGHKLSDQLGRVELGEDVELGACVTIDRGTWGATRVGAGSKLDNQVMIGHNCQIGSHNLLCSQVGIAGSCTTGAFVVMAGQVGIADHIDIGDEAILGAKSGVMHNLEGGQMYLGAPAVPVREQMQLLTALSKLPTLRREFKQLRKQVNQPADSDSLDHPDAGPGQRAA